MSLDELRNELACGVTFWGLTIDGAVRGVMGIQPMRDIDLIRHAYVSPQLQRRGIGAALLQHLRHASTRRMLVGTWAAAGWAIDFYRRNDFVLVPADATPGLLRTYWTIPERQIQTSVVLANPPLTALPSSADDKPTHAA